MSKANEPTADGPTAPKQDRMAAARAAKTQKKSEIEELREALAQVQAQLKAAPIIDDKPGPDAAAGQVPGEYLEDGKDPASGRTIFRKRRWTMSLIKSRYEPVTFTPVVSMPVKPHGVKPGWDLAAGVEITVPSIVKTLYEDSLRAIERQTKAYPTPPGDVERTIFDAAKKAPGPHYTPVQHVGFGWSETALAAAATGKVDPAHEPEAGFPGGWGGQPLDDSK